MESTLRSHTNRNAREGETRGTVVVGFKLEHGDTTQENDVYESTSGRWEKIPNPGITLGQSHGATIIRPSKVS